MSARPKFFGRVSLHGTNVKDAPNAASGDAAYNLPLPADVGRVPPHGVPGGRKKEGGGLGKAHQLLGDQLPKRLDELNEVLAA